MPKFVFRFFSVAFLLTLLAATAVAQNTLPDTPPGRLMKTWLELFNAGEQSAGTKFLGEHFSPEARGGLTPEQAFQRQQRLREVVGGGFDVYKVEKSSENEVEVLMRERSQVGWADLRLKLKPDNPNMALEFTIIRVSAPPEATPQREDATALAADLDHFVTQMTAKGRFSGVVLMAKDGKPFFQKAYGYADRDKRTPNTIDTRFRLGSMNKMFTGVAITQLVQQGKMGFNDTVAKLLPDYPDKDIAAKISVKDLLTHTSGLGDIFGPEFDKKKDSLRTLKDYLQLFAGKPLLFDPGTRFQYSNAGMIVAGLIVEKVSGQDYFSYVRDHIYKPAGMTASGTLEKTKPEPNLAIGYTRESGKLASNYDTLPLMGSSAGGGDSTAPDLLRFDQALRHHVLLNPDMTSTVTTGKIATGGDSQYAYGFEVTKVDGKPVVGHGGGAPGMNANLDMYWDSGYTVVVLANLDPPVANQVNTYIQERIKQ
jgi:CubicO group peptidase (beta-lactamase class C family)